MTKPLTKEQIELAKQKQRAIITECDKALADLQYNIDVLNGLAVQRTATKKQAQDTLTDLDDDFPIVQSTTTAPGSLDATSVVDATLINSPIEFVGKILKIKPSDPMEDSSNIVEFKKDKGEVIVSKPLKGGQVLKNVPYKILEKIPDEVT